MALKTSAWQKNHQSKQMDGTKCKNCDGNCTCEKPCDNCSCVCVNCGNPVDQCVCEEAPTPNQYNDF